MARLNFRQGIVRHQTDVSNNPTFLQQSGSYVDLIISPDYTVLNFIHNTTDYVYTESVTVDDAWGPFSPGVDAWLYWDLSLSTGVVTRSFTTVEPITSFYAPVSPAAGQMWFNTSTNTWYEYSGSLFVEVVRVFAAKYVGAATLVSVSINAPDFKGTQVGITTPIRGGSLVFGANGKPIRSGNARQFFTTEDKFVTGVPTGASLRVNNIIITGKANAPLAAYSIVQYEDFDTVGPALATEQGQKALGIIEEDAVTNEVVNFTVEGMIANEAWDWVGDGADVNDPIYINNAGEIVLAPVVPEQLPIGVILGKQEILFAPKLFPQGSGAMGPNPFIPYTEKGAPDGVATLGPTGLIPTSQIPPLAITDTYVVSDEPSMLALVVQTGDVAVRTDQTKSYILQGTDPSVIGDWQELLSPAGAVISVNSQTGAVVLSKTDIGLANVDNTSDLNKPISTTTQTALDLKLQSGSNISVLTNDAGYLTSIGSISGHTDVDLTGITSGQVLEWNGSTFVAATPSSSTVASVNTQTGAVVLDADDISDTSTTNKFATAAELLLVSSALQSGSNISVLANDSGYLTTVGSISGHTDVDLTGIALGQVLEWNGSTFVAATPATAAVDSVNTQTGAVVLDADDISDTATTNKFATAAELLLVASALQSSDNVSVLTNDAGYLTTIGSISGHTDVDLTGITSGQVLEWNGSTFIAATSSTGETNTASNLGAGEGVFGAKVSDDLQFKSIVAGTNVSLTSDANTVTINSTGGGGGATEYIRVNYTFGNIIDSITTSTGISAVVTTNSVNTNNLVDITFTASVIHPRPPTSAMVYGFVYGNDNYVVRDFNMNYGGQPTTLDAGGEYDITSGSIVGLVLNDIQLTTGNTFASKGVVPGENTHAYIVFGW